MRNARLKTICTKWGISDLDRRVNDFLEILDEKGLGYQIQMQIVPAPINEVPELDDDLLYCFIFYEREK